MKILFAGEGGQGVQAVAEILAQAAFSEGKHTLYIPNFGVEQRGGTSLAFVVIDKIPVVYPKFEKADVLALFSDRSVPRATRYIQPATKVILSPAVKTSQIPQVSKAFHLRGGIGITPRVWNILVLGKLNKIGQIVSRESLIKAMDERFARQFKKNPELRKLDVQALTQASN